MKKLIILSLTVSFFKNCFTQNVGIGTGSPAEKLHLVGDFRQDNGTVILNNASGAIHFQNAGANKTYMQLSGNDMRLGTVSGNQFGKTIFRMAGQDRVLIDSTGNIQVLGLQDVSLTSHGYLTLGSLSGINLILDNNEIQARNQLNFSNLILQNEGGNVGIGVISPTDKVHVNGNIRSTGTVYADIVNASGSISTNGNMAVLGTGFINGEISTNSSLRINDPSGIVNFQSSGTDKGFIQLSGDNLRVGTYSNNTNGNFVIRTGGQDQVTVNSDGDMNVRSKITSPATGLYNLLPICYGTVESNGSIRVVASTANFTVSHPSTGQYEITLSGGVGYEGLIIASPRQSDCVVSAVYDVITLKFKISARNISTNALHDAGFNFVIYDF